MILQYFRLYLSFTLIIIKTLNYFTGHILEICVSHFSPRKACDFLYILCLVMFIPFTTIVHVLKYTENNLNLSYLEQHFLKKFSFCTIFKKQQFNS